MSAPDERESAPWDQPNLFFIGGMRCGSTSINHLLGQHPEIFMSAIKEPDFYLAETARRSAADAADRHRLDLLERSGKYRTRATYHGLFAEAGEARWRGESSHYLYHPSVIPTILSDCPHARFLVSVRNPIDRIFSEFLRLCRIGEETRSFDAFVHDMRARKGEAHLLGPKLDKGLQGHHLAPWLSGVPTGNLHWIVFDDFEDHPVACLQSVFGWLGVDPTFQPDVVRTQMGGVQSVSGLERLMRARRFGARRLKQFLPSGAKRKLIDLIHSRTLRRPSISPPVRALLEDLYRDDVRRLGDMIQRDLSFWLEPQAPSPGAAR